MAPIEAEATGIGWAVEHCSYDLKGSDKVVTIVTNHYPLVAVFDKCAFDLSQRLWNVRSRLMDYRIQVSWVPGKQQLAADALGQNPIWPGTVENSGEKIVTLGMKTYALLPMSTGRSVPSKSSSETQ